MDESSFTLQDRIDQLHGAHAALFCVVKTLLAVNPLDEKGRFMLGLSFQEGRAHFLNSPSEAALQGFEETAEFLTQQAGG